MGQLREVFTEILRVTLKSRNFVNKDPVQAKPRKQKAEPAMLAKQRSP